MRDRFDEPEDAQADDDLVGRRRWPVALLGLMLRRPQDTLAAAVASTALATILVNALFLQPDPHPAPIFPAKPKQSSVTARESTGTVTLPRPRPPQAPGRAEAPPRAAPGHSRNEAAGEVQRESARRPPPAPARSPASVRAEPIAPRRADPIGELAARSEPVPAPPEPSGVRHEPSAVRPEPAAVRHEPSAPTPSDPSASGPAPSKQVRALQQALSEFGYGQIKPSGVPDSATRAAIEAFESSRNMPVTGQISDRLLRELAVVTGRPLD